MTFVSIPGLAAATAGALVGNTFSATLGLNQTQIGPPAIYGNISLQVQGFFWSLNTLIKLSQVHLYSDV